MESQSAQDIRIQRISDRCQQSLEKAREYPFPETAQRLRENMNPLDSYPETPGPEDIPKLQFGPSKESPSDSGAFNQNLDSENKMEISADKLIHSDSEDDLNCSSSGFNTNQLGIDSSIKNQKNKIYHKRDTSDNDQVAITSAKQGLVILGQQDSSSGL